MSLSLHFEFNTNARWFHVGLSPMSFLCHIEFTPLLFRLNFDLTEISLRRHFCFICMSLCSHFGYLRWQFIDTSTSLRCHVDARRFNFDCSSSSVQFQFLSCRCVFDCIWCALRIHFEVTSIFLWRQINFTTMSRRCSFEFTSMSCRCHFEFVSISLVGHVEFTSMSLWVHVVCASNDFHTHSDSTSMSLRFHCEFTSGPLRGRSEFTSIHRRLHCDAISNGCYSISSLRRVHSTSRQVSFEFTPCSLWCHVEFTSNSLWCRFDFLPNWMVSLRLHVYLCWVRCEELRSWVELMHFMWFDLELILMLLKFRLDSLDLTTKEDKFPSQAKKGNVARTNTLPNSHPVSRPRARTARHETISQLDLHSNLGRICQCSAKFAENMFILLDHCLWDSHIWNRKHSGLSSFPQTSCVYFPPPPYL